jgi:hypothetical protein
MALEQEKAQKRANMMKYSTRCVNDDKDKTVHCH